VLGWNSSKANAGEAWSSAKTHLDRYKGVVAEKYHDKRADKKNIVGLAAPGRFGELQAWGD
jgi:hypothetical protein